LTPWN